MVLLCSNCRIKYPDSEALRVCRKCGQPLSVTYDYDKIRETLSIKEISKRPFRLWRYLELLPITEDAQVFSLGEGGTYLHRCDRLAKSLRLKKLYLKNETTNPTGSFMDRGVTVTVTKVKETGIRTVCCAPTGNLGSSLAAYAAKAYLECRVFISREVDLGKLYQMIAFGADVQTARDVDDAYQKATKIADRSYLVTPEDPYLLEGEKTIGYEICEQLDWHTPDFIVVPMGTGGNLSMIWKGIQEFLQIGLIRNSHAVMVGIQSSSHSPIVDAFKGARKLEESKGEGRSLAVDIAVKNPALGDAALKVIETSKGIATSVSDNEILEATRLLAKTEGIFAEPAAGSTIAGLTKLVESGEVARDQEVVCIITGSGLKDPYTARKFADEMKRTRKLVNSIDEGRDVRLGGTKMNILKILQNRELYGYGIWKELLTYHSKKVTVPTVYQHLQEMEMRGLLKRTRREESVGRPDRWYYILTERGREALKAFSRL